MRRKGVQILTEECLKMQKLVFYGNQNFEEGHRPIEVVRKKKKEAKMKDSDRDRYTGETQIRKQKG